MAKSILIQVLIGVGIGILLSMLWLWFLGNDLRQGIMLGPLLFLAAGALAILAWVLMLTLFRKRMAQVGRGGRVLWSLLAAVIAGAFNLVVGSSVGLALGGWDAFLVLFVFIATVAFGVGALISNLLTNLAIAPPRIEPVAVD